MSVDTAPRVAKSWRHEPLVWLVVAIPASAVLMGAVMITLAILSDDGLVRDDYYRQGLLINRVLARDERARELGLSARIEWTSGEIRLEILRRGAQTGHEGAWPPMLELSLVNATHAGSDRTYILAHRGAGRYEAEAPPLAPGNWKLELAGPDWRLGASHVQGPEIRLEPRHPS